MIPKIIWQTHEATFDKLEEPYSLNALTWKNNNLDWDYRYTNKEERRLDVLQFRPDLIDIFDFFEHGISKSDIWRLIVLEKFGGFYADIDSICRKSLNYIQFNNEINTTKTGSGFCNIRNKTFSPIFATGFLGLQKNSFVITEVLKEMRYRYDTIVKPNKNDPSKFINVVDYWMVSEVFAKYQDRISETITNCELFCSGSCKDNVYICHGVSHGGRWNKQYR